MSSRYAEKTAVSSDRSRAEIERTLQRYGAEGFMYGWEGRRAMIAFQAAGRNIKFVLPLPDRYSEEFTLTPTGRERSASQAAAAYEQGIRQSWRALALCIKAKLEAVEAGITTFDEEFMAHIVLPDGRTVGETAIPAIRQSYESGKDVKLLSLL